MNTLYIQQTLPALLLQKCIFFFTVGRIIDTRLIVEKNGRIYTVSLLFRL